MGPVFLFCSLQIYILRIPAKKKKTSPSNTHLKTHQQKSVPRQRLGREVEFLKPWLGGAWEEGCGWQCRFGNQKRGLQQRFGREVDGREIKSLCQQNLRGWHGKIWRKRRKLQQTTHPFSEGKKPKNTYSTLTLIIICICICLHDVKSILYIYKISNIYLHLPKAAIEPPLGPPKKFGQDFLSASAWARCGRSLRQSQQCISYHFQNQ